MADTIPKRSFLRHALSFARGRVPSQLIIQLTDSCNATCPQCGMRRNAPFRRSLLSLYDGKRIIDHAAASGLYTFWISIDSPVPEVHEGMRGLPGVMKGIERALPIFREHGVFPSANLGITKRILAERPAADAGSPAPAEEFREGFRAFFNGVADLGFTIANACYPMSTETSSSLSLDPVYGATAAVDSVRFSHEEKRNMFRALRDTIPEFRSRIRIFSPLSSLHALERQYSGEGEWSRPCRGGNDFFFIDAKCGDTYPCGYRGADNLGKFWDLNLKRPPFIPSCRECDWECFRDPSELLGPFQEFFSTPVGLVRRMLRDRTHTSLWLNDLRYYWTTDFFHGRRPPDYRKLSRYATSPAAALCNEGPGSAEFQISTLKT